MFRRTIATACVLTAAGILAATLTATASPFNRATYFSFRTPVTLPGTEGFLTPYGETRNHDIAPDGNTFITVGDATRTESGALAAPQIRVVLNWMEDLKQRVPTR